MVTIYLRNKYEFNTVMFPYFDVVKFCNIWYTFRWQSTAPSGCCSWAEAAPHSARLPQPSPRYLRPSSLSSPRIARIIGKSFSFTLYLVWTPLFPRPWQTVGSAVSSLRRAWYTMHRRLGLGLYRSVTRCSPSASPRVRWSEIVARFPTPTASTPAAAEEWDGESKLPLTLTSGRNEL